MTCIFLLSRFFCFTLVMLMAASMFVTQKDDTDPVQAHVHVPGMYLPPASNPCLVKCLDILVGRVEQCLFVELYLSLS